MFLVFCPTKLSVLFRHFPSWSDWTSRPERGEGTGGKPPDQSQLSLDSGELKFSQRAATET